MEEINTEDHVFLLTFAARRTMQPQPGKPGCQTSTWLEKKVFGIVHSAYPLANSFQHQ